MFGVGAVELLIVLPLVIVSVAVPVAVVVLQVMIYRKVNRIEQRLTGQAG